MVKKLFSPSSISVNFVTKDGDQDWMRSILAGRILVNNENTTKFLEQFPLGDEDQARHPNFKKLIAKIWGEEMISKLDIGSKEQEDLLEYMGKYASQDGFLHVLKTAIMNNVEGAGYSFDSRGTESVMNFIPKGKSLIIEETVAVNRIRDKTNPENVFEGSEKEPLCVAKLQHEISITKQGIQHKINDIDFKYGADPKIKDIIDKRSIIEKVKDFFKNLLGYEQKITPGKGGP